jgi:hypothetical protein
MRTAFAVLCSCVLLAFGASLNPAAAGGYYSNGGYNGGYNGRYYGGYNGGYNGRYYGGGASVWYSSDCCYRKLVRHVRVVHYVPVEPYRRYGYYDRPYRYGYYGGPYRNGYYGRPYRYGYNGGGYRYGGGYYVGRGYGGYSNGSRYDDGYDAYNSVSSAKAKSCDKQRTRVPDGRGGWVWGVKTICR